ncbi:MAG: hypothetical protein IKY87_07150, partial [Paludibacteraceae bacterium]|nr:hypothetical protein [Paludibacteraceae bacterium]
AAVVAVVAAKVVAMIAEANVIANNNRLLDARLPETNKINKFYGKYFSDSGSSQRREIDPV